MTDSQQGVKGPSGPDRRQDSATRDRISEMQKQMQEHIDQVERDVADVILKNNIQQNLVRRSIIGAAVGFSLIAIAFAIVFWQFAETNGRQTSAAEDVARQAQRQGAAAQRQRRVSSVRACRDRESLKGEVRTILRVLLPKGFELPENPQTGKPFFAPLEDSNPKDKLDACENYGIDQTPTTKVGR